MGRSGAVFSTLLLAGAMLLGPGWGVQRCAAQSFPITLTDEQTFSIGVVQVVVDPSFAFLFAPAPSYAFYYPGYAGPASGILTGPVMYDGNIPWFRRHLPARRPELTKSSPRSSK
jgi:hypothetical protein